MNISKSMALVAFCALLPACSSMTEIAEQKHLSQLEARSFDLTGFTRVDIDADSLLSITQGDGYKVVLYTEPHHFPSMDIKVEDGTLKVNHKGRKHGDGHVKLEITAPSYDYIRVDAVVEAKITNLESENLEIILSSIGDIDIEGVCENLNLRVSGIGDFDARGLDCRHVKARVSGIGDTKVTATKSIDIKSSGIGDVSVYGSPQVKSMKASGIGDMNFKD